MIRYEDLVEGSRWIDGDGAEWELRQRVARNHRHLFVRPGITLPEPPVVLPPVAAGQVVIGIDEHHMNEYGWRRA